MDEAGKRSAAKGDGAAGETPHGLYEPPPFWQRWSKLYWLVAGLLVADVFACWLLTRWAT